jgi:hypothetical protein
MNTCAVEGSERDEGSTPLNPFEEVEIIKRQWRDWPAILRICTLAHRYLWLRSQGGYVLQADPDKCDAEIDLALAHEADDAEPVTQGPDTQL